MTTAGATFTLLGLTATGTADDLLGIWTPHADRSQIGPAVAFDPVSTPEPGEGPVWLVELAADPVPARAAIAAAEARLSAAEQALPEAAARLAAFAHRGHGGQPFALDSPPRSDQLEAETELDRLLTESRLVAVGRRPPAAFGPLDGLQAGWSEVTDWFSAVVGTVLAPFTRLGPVRTRTADGVLAHTLVSLTGGIATAWRSGLAATEIELHQRAVGLALATRAALMKVMSLALHGAAIAAVAFATPGGSLFALPAVWRFITRVQNEFAAIRQGITGKEPGRGQ